LPKEEVSHVYYQQAIISVGVAGSSLAFPFARAIAQTQSLSDVGQGMFSAPLPKIFRAREIVTLDPKRPMAKAIAVANGRMLAVGEFDEVRKARVTSLSRSTRPLPIT
jgi:hypothetical protein